MNRVDGANAVCCSVCDFECTHIIGTIEVKSNDEYRATEFIINHHHSITTSVKYSYRSQGNIHILFICEAGHYFMKSFDGHKGTVYIDNNPLMEELIDYLNEVRVHKDQKMLTFDVNYELLGDIEKFLNKTEESD